MIKRYLDNKFLCYQIIDKRVIIRTFYTDAERKEFLNSNIGCLLGCKSIDSLEIRGNFNETA